MSEPSKTAPPIPQPVVMAYLYGLLGLAMLNGIFSPLNFLVFALNPLWYPSIFPVDDRVLRFISSLLSATLTLMVAGVPAALYERVLGEKRTTQASLFVWMAALAVLSIPTVLVALAQLR